mgnify:CR=1 FL=1
MSNIVLKNVCKSYDKEHYAVQDFSLEIPDREFVIFVGPPAAENRRRFG